MHVVQLRTPSQLSEFLRLITYETLVLPASETRIIHGVVTFMEGIVEAMMKKNNRGRFANFVECANTYNLSIEVGDLNITQFLDSFASAQNMNIEQVSDCFLRHAHLMHDLHFLVFFRKWLDEDCRPEGALEYNARDKTRSEKSDTKVEKNSGDNQDTDLDKVTGTMEQSHTTTKPMAKE